MYGEHGGEVRLVNGKHGLGLDFILMQNPLTNEYKPIIQKLERKEKPSNEEMTHLINGVRDYGKNGSDIITEVKYLQDGTIDIIKGLIALSDRDFKKVTVDPDWEKVLRLIREFSVNSRYSHVMSYNGISGYHYHTTRKNDPGLEHASNFDIQKTKGGLPGIVISFPNGKLYAEYVEDRKSVV